MGPIIFQSKKLHDIYGGPGKVHGKPWNIYDLCPDSKLFFSSLVITTCSKSFIFSDTALESKIHINKKIPQKNPSSYILDWFPSCESNAT